MQDLPYIFIKLCIVLQLETSGIQITKQFPDSSSDFNLTDSLKEQVKRDFRSRGKEMNTSTLVTCEKILRKRCGILNSRIQNIKSNEDFVSENSQL